MMRPTDTERTTVVREVLRLTGPAVLTSFLQTLVFLVDRILLGRYSEAALASMQVQGPLLWSLWGIFTGLLVGTVPLVARSVGARDLSRARDVARAALLLAFVLGLGVSLSCGVLARPIVGVLGPDSAELRALSERYVVIALAGFPQMFVATTAAFVLHGTGNTRTPFVVGLLSNGVNVAASALLVFGLSWGPFHVPSLGVSGAAIGSALAFTVEAVLLLRALRDPSGTLGLVPLFQSGGPAARRDLLRVSTPALFERVVIHVGYLAYASVINSLGPVVMAANQALITLESICFLSADGFGVAAATVVGQALGRKDPRQARCGALVATGFAISALTTLGLAIWGSSSVTLGLFVPRGADGSALVAEAHSALPWLALSQPFMAIGVVLAQSLRGAGDTRSPVVAAVVGGFAVRVGLAWWLGAQLGLGVRAVWIASAVDWMVRTVWLSGVFLAGRWTRLEI